MNARIEIREAVEPGGPIQLSGHAATFDTPYRVGSFTETIARGAFKRTVGENPDVSLLVNHAGMPLARTTSGTMNLTEDDQGLYVRAELEPSDPDVQAVLPKLRRGDLSEMSFAFKANGQEWSKDKTKRTVRAVTIHRGDVSLVTVAANSSATATLRSQNLSLEQRERIAERAGDRVCATPGFIYEERVSMAPADTSKARSELDLIKARRGTRRRRGRLVAGTTTTTARSELDVVKARRARLNVHDRPAQEAKYSREEIEKLGDEGRARKRDNGPGYHFPIVDSEDVSHAVVALNRANPAEQAGVKRWIILRAAELKANNRLPPSWVKTGAQTYVGKK